MATPNQNIYKMCMRHGPSESSGFLKKTNVRQFNEHKLIVFLIDDVKYMKFEKNRYTSMWP